MMTKQQQRRRSQQILAAVSCCFVVWLILASHSNTVWTKRQQPRYEVSQRHLGLGGGISTYIRGIFSTKCPPPGFHARPTLDLDSYISQLWYPQAAAPVIYAQGQSYCSVVQYTRDNTSCWLCSDKPRINVRNRGLAGSVTGRLRDARLKAFVPHPIAAPAKIQVGSLQQYFSLSTNYWVVAADTYDNLLNSKVTSDGKIYDWALISGAAPFRDTVRGKCVPGFGRFDTRGLWLFARHPIPPTGVIGAATAYAEALGLDTSVWIPVVHEGCTYDFL
jgi:lipocalin